MKKSAGKIIRELKPAASVPPSFEIQIWLREHKASGQWEAVEREVDLLTNAVRVRRAKMFPTKESAERLCQLWKWRMDAEEAGALKSRKDNQWPINAEPPGEACGKQAGSDKILKADLDYSRCLTGKKYAKRYPRLFGLSARVTPKATDHELRCAFLLDYAELTGRRADGKTHKVDGLAEALKHGRRKRSMRTNINALVDDDLSFWWFHLGYCHLSENELADVINASHGTNFQPRAIAQRARRLGLKTKRFTGRPSADVGTL